ncbi:MAG: hypothetical protein KUG56_05275 [Kordiimonadaceae bacterium]|nr:hypothetical protein [Kordiimonadaceae bacterium]
MHDFAELDDPNREPLAEYHERIKVDIATFMLKRMVGNVSSEEERAEFLNACVAAAATLAAGQSVFLSSTTDTAEEGTEIIEAGLENAFETLTKAYNGYIREALNSNDV